MLPDLEPPGAMRDRGPDAAVLLGHTAGDALELEHRHLVERLVVEPEDLAAARDVAHGAEEGRDRAGAGIRDTGDQATEVDRLDRQLGERMGEASSPPETGGIRATSSPSCSRSSRSA